MALDYEKLRSLVAYARMRGWAMDPLCVARGKQPRGRRIATDEEFFERGEGDECEDDRQMACCSCKSSEYEGYEEEMLADNEPAALDMKYWTENFHGDKIRIEDVMPSSRLFCNGVSSRGLQLGIWEVEDLKTEWRNRFRGVVQ